MGAGSGGGRPSGGSGADSWTQNPGGPSQQMVQSTGARTVLPFAPGQQSPTQGRAESSLICGRPASSRRLAQAASRGTCSLTSPEGFPRPVHQCARTSCSVAPLSIPNHRRHPRGGRGPRATGTRASGLGSACAGVTAERVRTPPPDIPCPDLVVRQAHHEVLRSTEPSVASHEPTSSLMVSLSNHEAWRAQVRRRQRRWLAQLSRWSSSGPSPHRPRPWLPPSARPRAWLPSSRTGRRS